MSHPAQNQGLIRDYELPTPEPESPFRPRKPYRLGTLCATVDNPDQKDQYGSSSVPIYQTATFKGIDGQYDYTRSGNPTRSHLVILRLLKPGDEVIAGDDLYGGTNRLLTYLKTHGGVIVHHVDTTNPVNLHAHIKSGKTAMVLLESPTNPLLKVADLATIAAQVKERAPDALVVVDNTMMSPYLQRPLEYGADLVYDSATKYLSGHHDLMAGVITCNREELAKQIAFVINSIGNALTPFDCFLLLRGVKTLAIRMDRQQTSAMAVATTLERLGFKVHYPGLMNHPGRDIHERNADGYVLSERIVGATRLWGISVSFGCVNSLISMPCVMSYPRSIDPAVRAERGLPEDLIRLCVGIEDPTDLIDDLEHALLEAGAITVSAGADQHQFVRATVPRGGITISRAVILFGEHAVVHGVTAIAAAVGLRCYGLSSPRHDGKIALRFIDLDNFSHEWVLNDLPWDAVTSIGVGDSHPDSLDQRLVDAILQRGLPVNIDQNTQAKAAAVAFLYLYMVMTHGGERPSFSFAVRSTLPVGAGLGSSASFSSCVATALLLLHHRISLPPLPEPSRTPDEQAHDPGHVHVSHEGRRALPRQLAEEVNHWAFVAEKILHGNPSGVDNSVAVFGGALAYTRPGFGRKSGMEPIQGFKSFRFLLTDSRVPRDTKKLVAGVATKKLAEPAAVERILDSIQSISNEARQNHAHLVALGVSHPVLEAIREQTAAEPYRLSTKLTGAGGGGCAVTLVPDDVKESVLAALIETLTSSGFQPYLTSVGGSGLGILSPYDPANYTSDHPSALGHSDQQHSLHGTFQIKTVEELTAWAENRGRWLYV
ncbi:cystathionine beta-lyase [Lactifluus volemus]|nr:cystathionine beta-lyase [Lactifluus volemus]